MLLVLNAESTLQNTSSEFVRVETFTPEDIARSGEVCNEFKPTLEQINAQHPGYVARPGYRPVTKFENRGIKLGHGVWDLVYIKK
jgi:tRNA (guanine-N7-)-methyltransferase